MVQSKDIIFFVWICVAVGLFSSNVESSQKETESTTFKQRNPDFVLFKISEGHVLCDHDTDNVSKSHQCGPCGELKVNTQNESNSDIDSIVQVYNQTDMIKVKLDVLSVESGQIYFRLCYLSARFECFDKLYIVQNEQYEYNVTSGEVITELSLQIPGNARNGRYILQWNYLIESKHLFNCVDIGIENYKNEPFNNTLDETVGRSKGFNTAAIRQNDLNASADSGILSVNTSKAHKRVHALDLGTKTAQNIANETHFGEYAENNKSTFNVSMENSSNESYYQSTDIFHKNVSVAETTNDINSSSNDTDTQTNVVQSILGEIFNYLTGLSPMNVNGTDKDGHTHKDTRELGYTDNKDETEQVVLLEGNILLPEATTDRTVVIPNSMVTHTTSIKRTFQFKNGEHVKVSHKDAMDISNSTKPDTNSLLMAAVAQHNEDRVSIKTPIQNNSGDESYIHTPFDNNTYNVGDYNQTLKQGERPMEDRNTTTSKLAIHTYSKLRDETGVDAVPIKILRWNVNTKDTALTYANPYIYKTINTSGFDEYNITQYSDQNSSIDEVFYEEYTDMDTFNNSINHDTNVNNSDLNFNSLSTTIYDDIANVSGNQSNNSEKINHVTSISLTDVDLYGLLLPKLKKKTTNVLYENANRNSQTLYHNYRKAQLTQMKELSLNKLHSVSHDNSFSIGPKDLMEINIKSNIHNFDQIEKKRQENIFSEGKYVSPYRIKSQILAGKGPAMTWLSGKTPPLDQNKESESIHENLLSEYKNNHATQRYVLRPVLAYVNNPGDIKVKRIKKRNRKRKRKDGTTKQEVSSKNTRINATEKPNHPSVEQTSLKYDVTTGAAIINHTTENYIITAHFETAKNNREYRTDVQKALQSILTEKPKINVAQPIPLKTLSNNTQPIPIKTLTTNTQPSLIKTLSTTERKLPANVFGINVQSLDTKRKTTYPEYHTVVGENLQRQRIRPAATSNIESNVANKLLNPNYIAIRSISQNGFTIDNLKDSSDRQSVNQDQVGENVIPISTDEKVNISDVSKKENNEKRSRRIGSGSSVIADLMNIGFIDQDTLPIIDLTKPTQTMPNGNSATYDVLDESTQFIKPKIREIKKSEKNEIKNEYQEIHPKKDINYFHGVDNAVKVLYKSDTRMKRLPSVNNTFGSMTHTKTEVEDIHKQTKEHVDISMKTTTLTTKLTEYTNNVTEGWYTTRNKTLASTVLLGERTENSMNNSVSTTTLVTLQKDAYQLHAPIMNDTETPMINNEMGGKFKSTLRIKHNSVKLNASETAVDIGVSKSKLDFFPGRSTFTTTDKEDIQSKLPALNLNYELNTTSVPEEITLQRNVSYDSSKVFTDKESTTSSLTVDNVVKASTNQRSDDFTTENKKVTSGIVNRNSEKLHKDILETNKKNKDDAMIFTATETPHVEFQNASEIKPEVNDVVANQSSVKTLLDEPLDNSSNHSIEGTINHNTTAFTSLNGTNGIINDIMAQDDTTINLIKLQATAVYTETTEPLESDLTTITTKGISGSSDISEYPYNVNWTTRSTEPTMSEIITTTPSSSLKNVKMPSGRFDNNVLIKENEKEDLSNQGMQVKSNIKNILLSPKSKATLTFFDIITATNSYLQPSSHSKTRTSTNSQGIRKILSTSLASGNKTTLLLSTDASAFDETATGHVYTRPANILLMDNASSINITEMNIALHEITNKSETLGALDNLQLQLPKELTSSTILSTLEINVNDSFILTSPMPRSVHSTEIQPKPTLKHIILTTLHEEMRSNFSISVSNLTQNMQQKVINEISNGEVNISKPTSKLKAYTIRKHQNQPTVEKTEYNVNQTTIKSNKRKKGKPKTASNNSAIIKTNQHSVISDIGTSTAVVQMKVAIISSKEKDEVSNDIKTYSSSNNSSSKIIHLKSATDIVSAVDSGNQSTLTEMTTLDKSVTHNTFQAVITPQGVTDSEPKQVTSTGNIFSSNRIHNQKLTPEIISPAIEMTTAFSRMTIEPTISRIETTQEPIKIKYIAHGHEKQDETSSIKPETALNHTSPKSTMITGFNESTNIPLYDMRHFESLEPPSSELHISSKGFNRYTKNHSQFDWSNQPSKQTPLVSPVDLQEMIKQMINQTSNNTNQSQGMRQNIYDIKNVVQAKSAPKNHEVLLDHRDKKMSISAFTSLYEHPRNSARSAGLKSVSYTDVIRSFRGVRNKNSKSAVTNTTIKPGLEKLISTSANEVSKLNGIFVPNEYPTTTERHRSSDFLTDTHDNSSVSVNTSKQIESNSPSESVSVLMQPDSNSLDVVISNPDNVVVTGQYWPALVSQDLQWTDTAPHSMSLSIGHNTNGKYMSEPAAETDYNDGRKYFHLPAATKYVELTNSSGKLDRVYSMLDRHVIIQNNIGDRISGLSLSNSISMPISESTNKDIVKNTVQQEHSASKNVQNQPEVSVMFNEPRPTLSPNALEYSKNGDTSIVDSTLGDQYVLKKPLIFSATEQSQGNNEHYTERLNALKPYRMYTSAPGLTKHNTQLPQNVQFFNRNSLPTAFKQENRRFDNLQSGPEQGQIYFSTNIPGQWDNTNPQGSSVNIPSQSENNVEFAARRTPVHNMAHINAGASYINNGGIDIGVADINNGIATINKGVYKNNKDSIGNSVYKINSGVATINSGFVQMNTGASIMNTGAHNLNDATPKSIIQLPGLHIKTVKHFHEPTTNKLNRNNINNSNENQTSVHLNRLNTNRLSVNSLSNMEPLLRSSGNSGNRINGYTRPQTIERVIERTIENTTSIGQLAETVTANDVQLQFSGQAKINNVKNQIPGFNGLKIFSSNSGPVQNTAHNSNQSNLPPDPQHDSKNFLNGRSAIRIGHGNNGVPRSSSIYVPTLHNHFGERIRNQNNPPANGLSSNPFGVKLGLFEHQSNQATGGTTSKHIIPRDQTSSVIPGTAETIQFKLSKPTRTEGTTDKRIKSILLRNLMYNGERTKFLEKNRNNNLTDNSQSQHPNNGTNFKDATDVSRQTNRGRKTINFIGVNTGISTTAVTNVVCSATKLLSTVHKLSEWCTTRCSGKHNNCPKHICSCQNM